MDLESWTPRIKMLPIRRLDMQRKSEKSTHDMLVRLVDQFLAAKRADPEADTSQLEAGIDRHDCALYGLTDAEIAIVEGAGAKS